MLERFREAERGAACLCHLSSADHRGSSGVVSDIPNMLARPSPGWPSLELEDSRLVYQGPLPKSCHWAPRHQSAKEAEYAAVQTSAEAVVSWTGRATLFLLPSGMAWLSGGLTRHALRDVADSTQVSKYLDNPVPAVFPGCSRTAMAVCCCISRWTSSSVSSSGGFPLQSAPGSPHSAVHPGSRPVVFPGSDHHVFLARSGLLGVFPVLVSPGKHTGTPDRRSVLDVAGHGTSHPTSTRCPSADGTSFLKTVATTLKSRRVHCRADRGLHGAFKPPALWAEGRWPCLRAPVAFVAIRELHDGRVMHVAIVKSLCDN